MTPAALRRWRRQRPPARRDRRGPAPRCLSQSEAAAAAGVSLAAWRDWEQGRRRIPRHIHWLLAAAEGRAQPIARR